MANCCWCPLKRSQLFEVPKREMARKPGFYLPTICPCQSLPALACGSFGICRVSSRLADTSFSTTRSPSPNHPAESYQSPGQQTGSRQMWQQLGFLCAHHFGTFINPIVSVLTLKLSPHQLGNPRECRRHLGLPSLHFEKMKTHTTHPCSGTNEARNQALPSSPSPSRARYPNPPYLDGLGVSYMAGNPGYRGLTTIVSGLQPGLLV